MAVKNDLAKNSVKMLAIDMINKSETKHMGLALSWSSIIYSLYVNELNIMPKYPTWINRDRFFFSDNTVSSLLYSMLYHAGYDYSIDDLKKYCEYDSCTPGAISLNKELGIEQTNGNFGEAVAMAVGSALAERYYASICKSINKKSKLIDYYTYVLCSDKDIADGKTYEALSFASTQKLNKLIIICATNKFQTDGESESVFTEDVESRFEALDYDILFVKNGNNISDITSAISAAKKGNMPSIVFIDTKIGYDASFENSKDAYAKNIPNEEIINLKQKYSLSSEPFSVKKEICDFVSKKIVERVNKKYSNWQKEFVEAKQSRNPDFVNIINLLDRDEFIIDFDSTNYQINEKYNEEGHFSNHKAMNFVAPKTKFFLGGSADFLNNTKAYIEKSGFMNADNPSGRNIAFGNRISSVGNILNGMSLCGLRTFMSTFLVNADYLKPAMRLSSLMNLPVTYIYTHDNIASLRKGAVYQPVEQLAMLRSIPGMVTFRPCDINEIIGAWECIMKKKGPSALVISTEKMQILKHTNGKYVQYGAYIVRKEQYHLDGVIVASGSDVHTALTIAEELFKDGIDLRIVSMPSVELFLKQNPVYEEKLLPKEVKIVTLESSSSTPWLRFATDRNCVIGIDNFGTSGQKEDILEDASFNYQSIYNKIRKIFE